MENYVAKRSALGVFKPSLGFVAAFAFSGCVPSLAHQWSPGMPLAQANGMALAAWGAMCGAWLLAGSMASARDGKPMGKKFASIWSPIELVLAASVMIPMAGMSGQTMAQAIVSWVAALL